MVEDPSNEYAELVPLDAEFQVQYCERAGRFLTSTIPMPPGYDFLLESPLAVWPVSSECSGDSSPSDYPAAAGAPRRCEGCFTHLGAEGCRPRRRARRKRAADSEELVMYCEACAQRRECGRGFFTPELLQRWRSWQAAKSPASRVGLEAFARCFAQIAATAGSAGEALKLSPAEAVEAARRPFDRLVAPPEGSSVTLHGTSAAEIAAELRASQPFAAAVASAVRDADVAAELLSEASVVAMAGRLALNGACFEVLGEGNVAAIPVAGVFVMLSMMNHSCEPSVQIVPGPSSTVTLRAKRRVPAGGQLTISYAPTDWPVHERRTRLRHWFFECDCWRCDSEARVAEALGGMNCDLVAAAA